MRNRTIRRSQTITPLGVGAIYDVRGESFVAEDTSRWRGRLIFIPDAQRIAALMGVSNLREAPEAPETKGFSRASGVPFYRFPQWLFCTAANCRRLIRWSLTREGTLDPGDCPTCVSCGVYQELVPMRWVMVCANGHLADVDWWGWAHSDRTGLKQMTCAIRDELTFNMVEGRGGGLNSLSVRCSACRSERDLEGINSTHTPRSLGWSCRGRQPWLPADHEEACGEALVVVQRGASNVHFPVTASALDIPPHSDHGHDDVSLRIRADPNFGLLLANPDHPARDILIGEIVKNQGVSREQVEKELEIQLGADADGEIDFSQEQIIREEWGAFTRPGTGGRPAHPDDRFIVEPTDLSVRQRPAATTRSADLLAGKLQHLVKAPRLREIRALRGFQRYTMKNLVPADLNNSTDWLPAIEVYGEGIFIALNEESVQEWEIQSEVRERATTLEHRRERSFYSESLPVLTPRFIMIHTLAHLLVRQLSYQSGYSSSAIRERLYVAEQSKEGQPMAGLMVYTGEGDSEGTLGGLVRSGDPDWFLPMMITALQTADWCSLDPVCSESTSQGPDGLSLAACHACAVISETSCQYRNASLDRRLLLDPQFGYFSSVLAAVDNSRANGFI